MNLVLEGLPTHRMVNSDVLKIGVYGSYNKKIYLNYVNSLSILICSKQTLIFYGTQESLFLNKSKKGQEWSIYQVDRAITWLSNEGLLSNIAQEWNNISNI